MTFLLAVWEYILVFLLAAVPWVEIAVVIPLSILNGLNSFMVALLAFFGNLATVFLLIVFFEKYQEWRKKKKGENTKDSKRQKRAVKIWNKYGLPGLILVGPLLIGSHIAAFVGLLFGAKKQPVLLWSIISLGLWTVLITIASHYGLELIR